VNSINQYYATFIPGLQNYIADVVKKRLSDVVITMLLDGAVLFETDTTYDKLNFFCFNNIFAVINVFDHSQKIFTQKIHTEAQKFTGHGVKFIEKHIESFIDRNIDVRKSVIADNNRKFRTFRIVVSNENVPASIDEKLRTDAEKYISLLSGLKADRSLPDTEFWFLFRRVEARGEKDFSIFMKRLTLRPSWEKTLHKGELPAPLAWILCGLASLKHSDAVLDPFCGYGSIPEAAVKHFHITNFTACENNSEAAEYTAKKFKGKTGFVLYKSDFFNLIDDALIRQSIDAIVTDPPWGQYDKIESGFYKKMFDAFAMLLKTGGRAVVLCANNDEILKTVPASFEIQTQTPILLSGKKAVIYKYINRK